MMMLFNEDIESLTIKTFKTFQQSMKGVSCGVLVVGKRKKERVEKLCRALSVSRQSAKSPPPI